MSRRLALALVITGAVGIAACGGDSVTLSSRARADLHDRVSQIRSAAASSDPATARFLLQGLRERVADLERAGEISDEQRAGILAAVADVDDAFGLVPTTTTTTLAPAEDEEEGKGNGKDKHDD